MKTGRVLCTNMEECHQNGSEARIKKEITELGPRFGPF